MLDTERSLYDAGLEWPRATADVSIPLATMYKTTSVLPPPNAATN